MKNPIEVPPPGECECGDPRCVYVANLATAIDKLLTMAGQRDDTEAAR